ncbi:MAG TPA: hypothetical protein VNM38_08155 [Solirubrobacterales bacterium]|nr:hypothetical protein [Solirubrobacterales bacterium]
MAVKEGKLAGRAVTEQKLASAAVSVEKLAAAAVSSEKLAPDSVTGDKVVESTLDRVPNADQAQFANSAESANPYAFAAVDPEGNVNSTLSKGISNGDVSRNEPGVYCISSPGLNPRGAQVTLRNTGDSDTNAFVTVGGTIGCPAPRVEVRIYKGVLASAPFYVMLYR